MRDLRRLPWETLPSARINAPFIDWFWDVTEVPRCGRLTFLSFHPWEPEPVLVLQVNVLRYPALGHVLGPQVPPGRTKNLTFGAFWLVPEAIAAVRVSIEDAQRRTLGIWFLRADRAGAWYEIPEGAPEVQAALDSLEAMSLLAAAG